LNNKEETTCRRAKERKSTENYKSEQMSEKYGKTERWKSKSRNP
jgi:hypothetical protein